MQCWFLIGKVAVNRARQPANPRQPCSFCIDRVREKKRSPTNPGTMFGLLLLPRHLHTPCQTIRLLSAAPHRATPWHRVPSLQNEWRTMLCQFEDLSARWWMFLSSAGELDPVAGTIRLQRGIGCMVIQLKEFFRTRIRRIPSVTNDECRFCFVPMDLRSVWENDYSFGVRMQLG